MAKEKRKLKQRPAGQTADSPHPALKLRHTLRGHTGAVYRMALSPDGRRLASPSYDRTVRLWDVEGGRLLMTLKHQASVTCTTWSPDGKTLATGLGAMSRNVWLWDAATGRPLRVLNGKSIVIRIASSPDGRLLASYCMDKTIRLWDVADGRALREIEIGGKTNIFDPYRTEGFAW